MGNSELEGIHSTLEEIHSTLKSRTDWSLLFLVLFVIFLLESWPGSKLDRWTDRVWYWRNSNADWTNITVNKRPHDCDFLHTPLGSKDCHYRKHSDVFGDEQRRALIQRATTPEEAREYSQRPDTVTVYWERVEE
jgi:hypothetical protein